MKVGIVVPYSWSYRGGVVEHAEAQARALRGLGIETQTLIGLDPPGPLSKLLHPRSGRAGPPPDNVVALGRSAIVPGNNSLSNLVLGLGSPLRLARALARERFDLLHVHEPLAPTLGPAALALFDGPMVATFHAAGVSAWRPTAFRLWGFLFDRIDVRLAVSEPALETSRDYSPGTYELFPNGVELPETADPGSRTGHVVFVGRHERRKGLPVLLRAWPEIRRRTGLRLRLIGCDPPVVRLLLARLRVPEDGIDLLGVVDDDRLTAELASAKLLVAPSLGNESFGMVLTRAFACATPVVASDIDGYRAVVEPGTGVLVPPGDVAVLAEAVTGIVADEPERARLGAAARALARDRYAWLRLAAELAARYERLLGTAA
ncbi:MAG TPA: glycosyltransferase family 4 protein [Gaiellaceae bacterium]|nr:glycosyltransferase family 4 protein [Gaiellaceae bacterium]